MKKLFFAVLFMVATLGINAQSGSPEVLKEVKEGDILRIGRPDAPSFKHIDFPRANTIIKNGGTLQAKIKRTDGGRFFGLHTVVSADLRDALESGELRGI